jgi:DNA-binding Lrp family transcriptional regulator
MTMTAAAPPIDLIDRSLIQATQAGLPLCPKPYEAIAEVVGISAEDVMQRMKRMLAAGIVRRIGVVPNHYRLGYIANGMSVWDVSDHAIGDAGRQIGALSFVSHCYHRPRHLPDWPYNLFAMVHGRSCADVEAMVELIGEMLGATSRAHEVLYSTRILKKTGLRLSD